MEDDAITHIPISTLFLHSGCTQLAKKHLFDIRYLFLRVRIFSLINASVPLSPAERCYVDGTSYISYYFPDSANDVSVIGETLA